MARPGPRSRQVGKNSSKKVLKKCPIYSPLLLLPVTAAHRGLYDTKEHAMTNIHDVDRTATIAPDYTVASGWSSSPLGNPAAEYGQSPEYGQSFEFGQSFEPPDPVTPAAKPKSIGKAAALAAVLVGTIGVGAAVGMAIFDFTGSSQPRPAVVVPAPQPAAVVPGPAAPPAPAVVSPPDSGPGPAAFSPPDSGPAPATVSAPDSRPAPAAVSPPPDSGPAPADPGSQPVAAPVPPVLPPISLPPVVLPPITVQLPQLPPTQKATPTPLPLCTPQIIKAKGKCHF